MPAFSFAIQTLPYFSSIMTFKELLYDFSKRGNVSRIESGILDLADRQNRSLWTFYSWSILGNRSMEIVEVRILDED